MKISVCVPCMDKVDTAFVQALTRLDRGQDELEFFFTSCSLVYMARNQLAQKAFDSDLTLWLDSDMVFEPDLLQRMKTSMERNKVDFLTALAFRRRPPYSPCIYKQLIYRDDNKSTAVEYWDYPEDGAFQVEACGFANVLMKSQILWDCAEKFHDIFLPVAGYGEDISACMRFRQIGYKLWADPRIKVGHLTQMVITDKMWKQSKAGLQSKQEDKNGVS